MSQIKLKRGMKANLPSSLPLGEPAFCLDTQEMYVGQGKGKPLIKVNAQDFKEIDSKFEQTNTQLSNVKNELNSNYPSRFIKKLRSKERMTVLCKGDSMTYGMIQDGQAEFNYPFVLENKLKYIYDNQNITVINKGVSGTTTQHALDTISLDIQENPDVVFVMYGLNDSYEGNDGNVDIVLFEQNLNEIVKTYLNNNIEVVIMTPVPIISKSLGIDYEINVNQYCKIIKKVAEYNKLLCIDIYSELQNLMANYLITQSNYEISGHLSDYTIVADIILKDLISYKCDFKKGELIPFNTNLAYNNVTNKEVIAEDFEYMNTFYTVSKGDSSVIKFAYFHNQRGAKLSLNVYDKPNGGGGWLLNFGKNYYNIANRGVNNFNKLYEIPLLWGGLYFFEITGNSITTDSFEVAGAIII